MVGILDMDVGVPRFSGGVGEPIGRMMPVFGSWLSMITIPERRTMQKQGGSPQ